MEDRLRLKVNADKNAVADVEERQFLGYRLMRDGRLLTAPRSEQRAKQRIRAITRRNRGTSLEQTIRDVNGFVTGWVTYFRYADSERLLQRLESWIRRKLRSVRLKQRKKPQAVAAFLISLGVPERRARKMAGSGKGWWWKAATPQAHQVRTVALFRSQGLVSLPDRYRALQW